MAVDFAGKAGIFIACLCIFVVISAVFTPAHGLEPGEIIVLPEYGVEERDDEAKQEPGSKFDHQNTEDEPAKPVSPPGETVDTPVVFEEPLFPLEPPKHNSQETPEKIDHPVENPEEAESVLHSEEDREEDKSFFNKMQIQQAISENRLILGMNMEEVILSAGEPKTKAKWALGEKWIYPREKGGQALYFEEDILVSISMW